MLILIDDSTKTFETLSAFKQRYRDVSFGHVDQKVIDFLSPEQKLRLIDVGDQPSFDARFQTCILRDLYEVDGILTTKWAVINHPKEKLNAFYNEEVERFIDSKAQDLLYANQDRMISFIGDPDPQTNAEALYMKEWRSSVWAVVKVELEQLFKDLATNPIKKPFDPAFLLAKLPEFKVPSV